MTPREHNKFIGIGHLAYAGFHLLTMVFSLAVMGFMFQNIYSRSQAMGGPPPPPFLGVIFVLVIIFNIVTTVPPVVAGYALLKRRPWAKVAGIVSAVIAAMSFPIGTAIAVYTFWFLFSEPGKQLYGRQNQELPPLPPREWDARNNREPVESPTSASMPDWR